MVKRVGRSRHISHWDAEDVAAWEAGGKSVARRNLFWSIVVVHLGYAIWSLWPVMALFMPKDVYGFSAGDKLLLGMTATLVGACLRPTYAVATAIFGGRTLAMFSSFAMRRRWCAGRKATPLWSKRSSPIQIAPSPPFPVLRCRLRQHETELPCLIRSRVRTYACGWMGPVARECAEGCAG